MTTTATSRRLQYRQDLRTTILDAARELCLEEGFEALSMRKLGAKVGFSAAGLYQYFDSREAILRELIEESFRALVAAQAEAARTPEPDPVEALRRGLGGYVRFGLENPKAYRFAFLAPSASDGSDASRQAFDSLRMRVRRCIEAGRFRPVNEELAAQALWAAVHGVTSLLIVRPAFAWVEREALIEQVISSAIEGLRAPAA